MAQSRKAGPGRKSRGERELFSTRLPVALASQLRVDAERLDLSLTDALANLVAAAYGHPPVATPQPADQMKLTA